MRWPGRRRWSRRRDLPTRKISCSSFASAFPCPPSTSLASSELAVFLAQRLADDLRPGIEDKCHHKKQRGGKKWVSIEAPAVGRFRNLHRDVGGKRAKTVEQAPIHDRRIAGGHKHDHRFAHRPAEADHE